MVKVASSKDLAVSSSFSPTQTPSERKIGLLSPKVPVPTFNINVMSEDGKIKSKKVRSTEGNHIISTESLENILQMVAVCKKCKKGKLQIFEDASRVTSESRLMIRCNECSNYKPLWSASGQFGKDIQSAGEGAPQTQWNQMEVAAVLGSRVIGIGYESLKMYHAVLDVQAPPNALTVEKIITDVLFAAEMVAKQSMDDAKQALAKERGVNPPQDNVEIMASFDGAYPKKGKNSNLCFASMIDVDSARVLAYDVGNNSCTKCRGMDDKLKNSETTKEEYDNWKKSHSNTCPANYPNLPINQVESALAVTLLEQALNRGIVIAGLVCDGDNDTFKELNAQTQTIKEYECLVHVQRQIRKNLEKYNPEAFTWDICGRVSQLYYLAIMSGLGDVDNIVQKINTIPSDVQQAAGWLTTDTIKQIADVLSKYNYNSPRFLERVRFGKTTNNNESLHRLISRRMPKGATITNDSYRLGAALAVIQFNDGVSGIMKIFQRLRIEPGRRMTKLFRDLDARRVYDAKRRASQRQESLGVEQEVMKPMKQIQKYEKGYSAGKYTYALEDSSDSSEDDFSDDNY